MIWLLLVPLVALLWFPVGALVLLWAAYVNSSTDVDDRGWCFCMILFWPITFVFALLSTILFITMLPIGSRWMGGYYEIVQMTKRKSVARRDKNKRKQGSVDRGYDGY